MAQPNYQQMARQAAARHHLDPELFTRQIGAESNFNPGARSGAGAQGIAQIMPATARAWGVDPHDPAAALDAAAKAMAGYVHQFGGYENALRAYNAGPGNVERSRGFSETNAYVQKIMHGHSPAPASGSGSAPSAGAGPIQHKAVPGFSVNLPTSEQSTSFDSAGFEQARHRSILANYLAKRNPNSMLLRTGALSTAAPNRGDFTTTQTNVGTEKFTVPGSAANETGGSVEPSAGGLAATATQRANAIDAKHMPYLWGGGHGARIQDASKATPLDCSGAVSAVLNMDPRVSGAFASWGQAGDGGSKGVTVYANGHHVLMKINGRFFGTSGSNPGGGAGWIDAGAISPGYLQGFTVRHSAR